MPSPPESSTRFAAADEESPFLACHRLAGALLPPHRLRALLDFAGGSPARALTAAPADLFSPVVGLTERQAIRLGEAAHADVPARVWQSARELDVSVVTFRDPSYPVNLLPLSDAPPLLFVRGVFHPDDKFSLGIVGSRRATQYGRNQAQHFAQTFAARGLVVVSGGAAGIDTAAHKGALAAGRTIAVVGCGVDHVYPAENRALFAEIVARGGAIVSEFPLGTTPEPWRFPTRNRIIAGISRATLLIETPKDSGALITARNAAEYGRDVFVVPGPVDTGRSRGGHQLIQDGAILADSPDDVLVALGIDESPRPGEKALVPAAGALPSETAAAPPTNLTPDEARLLAQFDLSPRHLDEVAGEADLVAARATVAATLLEMKGLIRRQPGNLYVRAL